MNTMDIIFIVFLVIFALCGFKRGFLQELFKLLKWLFSYVGAKLLTSSVSLYLYEFFKIEEKLTNKVTEMVSSLDFSSLEGLRTTIEVGLTDIPLLGSYVGKALEKNWNLTELYQSGVADIQSKLMDEITPTAISFMESVTFILLFLLLIIIIGIIFDSIVRITHNSKLLGGADKLLGGVLGALKGVIIFILVFAILYLIASLTSSEYLLTLQSSRFFDIVNGMFNIIPK